MVSNSFPSLNAFFIREILYSIEMLHKHVQNQWWKGGEFDVKQE